MKKSLLAIVLAAATLPLTFAQDTPTQPDQKSTDSKSTKKSKKHHTKKTTGSTSTTTTSTPPQK